MKHHYVCVMGALLVMLSGCWDNTADQDTPTTPPVEVTDNTPLTHHENEEKDLSVSENVVLNSPHENTSTAVVNTTTISSNKCSDTTPKLCSNEPLSPDFSDNPDTLAEIQHDFDVFSWQLFVALNWPAKADGTADTNVMIGEKSGVETVWQRYKESRDIFLPNGAEPTAWGVSNPAPTVCGDTGNTPVLSQIGKTPNVLDESGQPFQTGPLIDQNGLYARFAILTNQQMFDYIVNNKLYSKAGQAQFNADADFPVNDNANKIPAAMMVKSAWKVMGENDDPSLFHTSKAYVYDNPNEYAGVKEACSLQTVGLVGLHMGTKVERNVQWIWSTFEHVKNVPTQGQGKPLDTQYNFYNPNCGSNCPPVNIPPPRPWNPATVHTQPSQIERVIPIDEATKALNKRYHDALKSVVPHSVWANYELVSTQWPTNPSSKTDPTGVPAPTFLANTTLESYIQGSVPQTSSSCIQCHNNAAMTNGKFSDFTYLLQRAQ